LLLAPIPCLRPDRLEEPLREGEFRNISELPAFPINLSFLVELVVACNSIVCLRANDGKFKG
jgi:hypothetical protein